MRREQSDVSFDLLSPTVAPATPQHEKVIGFRRISQVVLVVAGGGPDPWTPLASAAPDLSNLYFSFLLVLKACYI